MAKKVTVTLIDDVDQEAVADETVEFGLDGVLRDRPVVCECGETARAARRLGFPRAPGRPGAGGPRPPVHPARQESGGDRPRTERGDSRVGAAQWPQGFGPRSYLGGNHRGVQQSQLIFPGVCALVSPAPRMQAVSLAIGRADEGATRGECHALANCDRFIDFGGRVVLEHRRRGRSAPPRARYLSFRRHAGIDQSGRIGARQQ